MANTPNIDLRKPARTDLVSVVNDINDNMDKIDTFAGKLSAFEDVDIANDLTTEDPGKVLDARQGKVLSDHIENKTQWVYVGNSTVVNNSESVPSSDAIAYDSDTTELFLRIALEASAAYAFPMYVPLAGIVNSQSLYVTYYNNSSYNTAIVQVDKSARKVWLRLLSVNGTQKSTGNMYAYCRK